MNNQPDLMQKQTAYMMVKGSGSTGYRLLQAELDGNTVISTQEIGNEDLKSIVLGRLLQLLIRL